jgi:hypothetical protein
MGAGDLLIVDHEVIGWARAPPLNRDRASRERRIVLLVGRRVTASR